MRIFLNFLIFLIVLSCSSQSKIERLNSDSTILAHHVSYDASKRGSLIYQKDGNLYMLSEPPPDVATKLATELGAKVKGANQLDVEAYMSTSKAIAELGKRTASVNMLRDALYKLSEMRMSGNAIDNDTKYLFREILLAIQEMHKVEMEAEKTEQVKAETDKIQAQIKLQNINKSFTENIELGAKANYQIALGYLADKKVKEAKDYFKAMYTKYPTHYHIDEINKLLNSYEETIPEEGWKKIYDLLKETNGYGIDKELYNKFNIKKNSHEN